MVQWIAGEEGGGREARGEHCAAATAPRVGRVGSVSGHRRSRRLLGGVGVEFADVLQQFFDRSHAAEVELQHFPGPLGRLPAGPQTDEQTGDDAQVDLDGHAVLAGG